MDFREIVPAVASANPGDDHRRRHRLGDHPRHVALPDAPGRALRRDRRRLPVGADGPRAGPVERTTIA